jgi:peptidoglycan/LPS O-acetylase OafA/YrhL
MAEALSASTAATARHTAPRGRDARFPSLDGLRIVGALAVVSTHVGFTSGASLDGPFAGLLSRLDAGVPLFFVVSGFLLYRPHVRARLGLASAPRVGTYLKHRALRILPALWLAVAASAFLLPHEATATPVVFLRYATLTQIYSTLPSLAGLTQLWSLATEVAFYLLLPLLAWLLARRASTARRWAVRTTAVLGALPLLGAVWVGVATATDNALAMLWLPAFLGWFGLGMALATWNVARSAGLIPETSLDRLANAPGSLYAAAAALLVLVGTPVAGPYDLSPPTVGQAVVKNLSYGLLAVLLVLPAVAPGSTRSRLMRALGSRPGRLLGDISYGVFAYHLCVLRVAEVAIHHETFGGQFAQLWLLTVAATLPLAWVSYRFVERPIMRWGRRGERAASIATTDTAASTAT